MGAGVITCAAWMATVVMDTAGLWKESGQAMGTCAFNRTLQILVEALFNKWMDGKMDRCMDGYMEKLMNETNALT